MGQENFCAGCGNPIQGSAQNTQPNAMFTNTNNETPKQPTSNKREWAALICGILAATIPYPVIDIIVGAIGIGLVTINYKRNSNLRTTALVVAIIGTIIAVTFTIGYFSGAEWAQELVP